MKKILLSVLVSLLSIVGFTESIQDKLLSLSISVAKERIESTDFELVDTNGRSRKLSSYRGKVVFLNFWATWCGPCRYEMPSMQRLYDELRNDGLEIIAVNLQENKRQVRQFLDQYGLTFTVLLDSSGKVGAIYGARSIPITYLIDREGFIFARTIGAREWDSEEIVSTFRDILKSGPKQGS